MNRNSLYILILALGVALGVVYVNKTKGGLDKMFSPAPPASEGWMKDGPAWEAPKGEAPKAEPTPTPPQEFPTPPEEKKKPSQPNRRRQNQPPQQQPG